MAVKVADKFQAMGSFELLDASDVNVTIDGTEKRLQSAIDDGDIGKIDDTTASATTVYSSNKINTDYPFKLGIDDDGNYGYYKDGADTVTPFKTGDDFLSLAPTFDESVTYDHDSVVLKDDKLYQYTGADDTFVGAWDSSKWTEVLIPTIEKENGGGVDPSELTVLLWENPSPTSSFSAQTISLDLSNYSGVIIEYYRYTSNQKICTRVYAKLNETNTVDFGAGTNDGTYSYGRTLEISETGVTFNNGSSSTVIIPYKIYGVKVDLI